MTITDIQYGLFETVDPEAVLDTDMAMEFSVPLDFISQWKRCGMISGFIANYQAVSAAKKEWLQAILTYVVNELLENALKFSHESFKLVTLSLKQVGDHVIIDIESVCEEEHYLNFSQYIQDVTESPNVEEIFTERLMKAASSTDDSSGLGLLTILHDYQGEIGVRLRPKPRSEGLYIVFIRVQLSLSKLDVI